MKLKVPLVKQGYKECAPTSISMIMKFFGKDYSPDYITKTIGGITKDSKGNEVGTLNIDLAIFSQEKGFETYCYTYNIELLKPSFVRLDRPELKQEIEELLKAEKNDFDKRVLSAYLKFIDLDGVLEMKMPSLKLVENYILKGIPVLISLRTKILREKDGIENWSGHAIVITGFDGDTFYYNDPKDGAENEINREKLFFALSNNVLDSTGYMLILEKY
ncbi:MAG: hypothetical protein UT66_C0017G0005 [candidate division CPR2 bacterium GW2011_GWC1_39_9]|uniref:Peptidase C39-like domain-containing protein n=1 Tax=candidate division CPR2 bacterium GW2011_GWC2_39_10 TaxID=1618345 RepID=A0A0G0LTU0_UNCC2|nr:MAG: hypothetical protein UT18_C0010G0014 [candidate division CPR2 bacterium GW2011_GWC2_39_10]KKR34726.1 MAG: hypothetical protein UT66_C0017G0005 [candidate division CPR2 bacterium GW2011_GWC1_39_9]